MTATDYLPKRSSVSRCSSARRRRAFARSWAVPANPRTSLADFAREEAVFEPVLAFGLVLVLDFVGLTPAS